MKKKAIHPTIPISQVLKARKALAAAEKIAVPIKPVDLNPPRIKPRKLIIYTDLSDAIAIHAVIDEALRFALPDKATAYRRYSLWRNKKNWGVQLQVFGSSSAPATGVKNMVIYIKWKHKSGILEPCKGYLDLVKRIEAAEVNLIKPYLQG